LAVALVNVALIVAALIAVFRCCVTLVDILIFLYFAAYLSSLKIALISTFFTLLIGYPIYAIWRAPLNIGGPHC
jgi:putrescine transport system permease protein